MRRPNFTLLHIQSARCRARCLQIRCQFMPILSKNKLKFDSDSEQMEPIKRLNPVVLNNPDLGSVESEGARHITQSQTDNKILRS